MGLTLLRLLSLVAQQAPDLNVTIERGGECEVQQFSDLSQAQTGDIAFLANLKYAVQLPLTQATAIIMDERAWNDHRHCVTCQGVILCSNPYAFFAFASQVLQALADQQASDQSRVVNQSNSFLHPTAVIDASAVIGAGTRIGPYVVVESQAVIASGCTIDAHCVVGAGAKIGENSRLYNHVTLYHGVQLGQRCVIHSGTVIGSDGFGFAPYQKRWIKIPQTGTVRIGDDVEIGSNCSIDRGALGDTAIGRGTKLDNLIQIAHNVQIGEDCAFAANIAIAGSAVIGNRVQMGGKAGVLGHLSVCDDVIISSCTLVTKTISKPGFYTGVYPIQENTEWEKNAVSLKRLNTLREQVKALEKYIKNEA